MPETSIQVDIREYSRYCPGRSDVLEHEQALAFCNEDHQPEEEGSMHKLTMISP
jgi:hypothetical protein